MKKKILQAKEKEIVKAGRLVFDALFGEDGNLVITKVAGSGGAVTAQSTFPIDISSDGTLYQNGQAMGQLDIADFTSTAGLAKRGNNYFQADPSVRPIAPSATSIEQGKLESSNTGTAESAVRLVDIMRQFEMLQKAVLIGNDMSKQAIEQVAKVGS